MIPLQLAEGSREVEEGRTGDLTHRRAAGDTTGGRLDRKSAERLWQKSDTVLRAGWGTVMLGCTACGLRPPRGAIPTGPHQNSGT